MRSQRQHPLLLQTGVPSHQVFGKHHGGVPHRLAKVLGVGVLRKAATKYKHVHKLMATKSGRGA